MTKREFFEQVKVMVGENEEMVAICDAELLSLDKALASSRKRAAKLAAEKEGIRKMVLEVLTETPQTAAEIVEQLDGVKSASIASLLKPFVEDGTVVKGEKKGASKSMVKTYALAENSEE